MKPPWDADAAADAVYLNVIVVQMLCDAESMIRMTTVLKVHREF